jgi:pantetheine-phosphate adenylyltransferase
MKRIAVYPGSFDPITFGHLDVIKRSACLVDELVVGVLVNQSKTPLFSANERVNMIQVATQNLSNVRVEEFSGLSVEFAKKCGAHLIVRGLRAITDFEYELQMAQTNRVIDPEIDTIFLTTSLKYAYLSSTTVREVASYGGDISHFIPEELIGTVTERVMERSPLKLNK